MKNTSSKFQFLVLFQWLLSLRTTIWKSQWIFTLLNIMLPSYFSVFQLFSVIFTSLDSSSSNLPISGRFADHYHIPPKVCFLSFLKDSEFCTYGCCCSLQCCGWANLPHSRGGTLQNNIPKWTYLHLGSISNGMNFYQFYFTRALHAPLDSCPTWMFHSTMRLF